MGQNSNCDQAQKLNLWQNFKKTNCAKPKNSNCDKTQKPKLWQNWSTQNFDKTWIMTHVNLWGGGEKPKKKKSEKTF